jgi:signal transduction histidine kinase
VSRELNEMRAAQPVTRKSQPEIEIPPRPEGDDRLESIRRRLVTVQEFVAELAAIGESDPNEMQREVDLLEVLRTEVRSLEVRAMRAGVEVRIRTLPEGSDPRISARLSPRSASALLRELLAHAIAATPKGQSVTVLLQSPGFEEGLGSRMTVDDSGTTLPAAARRGLLSLEVEPGTFGRPSSVGLFAAGLIAAAQGALLELSDAPVEEGRGGGMRVTVTFPR